MDSFLTISPYDDDYVERLIERYDDDIRRSAQQKMPRQFFQSDVVDLETDELTQSTRIRFWSKVRKKERIDSPKAYIMRIAATAAIDIIRRHKFILSLPIGEDGELYQGDVLAISGEGMRDPAFEFECGEVRPERLEAIADAILALPPEQKRAMLCSLKELRNEVSPLIEEFRKRKICIESFDWPEDAKEQVNLKASLSHARKKLLFLKDYDEVV